jgi:chromate transporter
LFFTFFKIGLFTFGGGYAMLPLIEREVTGRRRYISREQLTDILALSQAVPGAIAINSATLIGYTLYGRPGALAATLGVILPSFLIISVIAAFFGTFSENRFVKLAFAGIRAAVVALIGAAVLRVGRSSIRDAFGVALAAISATLVAFFSVSPIWVILGGAVAGLALYGVRPHKDNTAPDQGEESRP